MILNKIVPKKFKILKLVGIIITKKYKKLINKMGNIPYSLNIFLFNFSDNYYNLMIPEPKDVFFKNKL